MKRRARPAAMSVLVVGLGLSVAVGLTWATGLAAGPGAVSAPAPASGPAAGTARAPRAEELAASVVALTAPEMEGRGSGTMGGDRAARYLADQLARSGFRPGGDAGTFLQWFAVGSTARAAAGTALERVAPAPGLLALGRDWAPHGGSLAGDAAGEAVFVGYGLPGPDGSPGDYIDVSGKIAVALDGGVPGASPAPSRLEKLIAARRHGAAAFLIAGDALPSLEATATSVKLVSGSLTREGADALLASSGKSLAGLASARPVRPLPTGVQIRLRVRLDRQERRTANVIGILPGTDPALASEVVVLGAHYDHLGRAGGVVHPGADDNASGTAVVLGMARALAAAGGTARTLVVVFFSGEEIGLLGSAYYVTHPPLPIERTAAMLNFDMVGRMRNDRLNIGGVESGSGLRALVGGGDRLDLVVRDSPYSPSDHTSFYAAGVPVLFFHTGGHDDYHAPGDTADKTNAVGMAEVARLGLRIAERLGGGARPAYVALARPDDVSRSGSGGGGDGSGAFLGVSVDGRSESDGIKLGSVMAGSGAERAGLRGGDVIVRMGDQGLSRFEDLRRALADRRPGDAVALVYLRDGEERRASATLGARP